MSEVISGSLKKTIKEELKTVHEKLNLDINTDAVKTSLLVQTVLGRAREGHGGFDGNKNPNITQTQIIEACKLRPKQVKKTRQELIDEVQPCFERLFHKKSKKLVNKKGQPLFRVKFLSDLELELDKETFKGSVLAARMDSSFWRGQTQRYFQTDLTKKPLQIGRGSEYPINEKKLKQTGLNFEDLTKKRHGKQSIEYYKEIGLIINENSKEVETQFIRHEKGTGVCDDAAFIGIGIQHGIDAMVLAFIVDAIDTYGKYSTRVRNGGLDEEIGEYLNHLWKERYKEELVTPEETMEVIYFAHKNNFPEIPISSSHRRFVEYEKGCKTPTFVTHKNYVKAGSKERFSREHQVIFQIGFERLKSDTFYEAIEKRAKLMGWKNEH